MAKDTTKTILIIGGVIGGIYLLSKTGIKEQISDALGGLSFDLTMPSIEIPSLDIPGLADLVKEGLKLNLPTLPGCGDGSCNLPGGADGNGHATWEDVAYTTPSWGKGVLAVGAGIGAGILAGAGGYLAIKAGGPVLKALGIQTARAIGGAGNIISRLLGRSVSTQVSGQVVKNVPVRAVAATATKGGILGSLLPTLAFTGITEGAYQIYRMFRGEGYIGMTGTGILDIVNLIRGKSALFQPFWLSDEEMLAQARATYGKTPSLGDAIMSLFSGGPVGAAQTELANPINVPWTATAEFTPVGGQAVGGSPATVAPSPPSAARAGVTSAIQKADILPGFTQADNITFLIEKAARFENKYL